MNNIPALLNHLDANRESPTLSLAYASISDEGIVEANIVSRFVSSTTALFWTASSVDQRYIKEIRQAEEALQRVISEKEKSAAEEQQLRKARPLEQRLKRSFAMFLFILCYLCCEELRELQVEKKDLQERDALHIYKRQMLGSYNPPKDKVALNVKDLELLEQDYLQN
eukprot:Skav215825  [mRNA]  locus=scaffold4622:34261:39447:+ [translate_table: standard]